MNDTSLVTLILVYILILQTNQHFDTTFGYRKKHVYIYRVSVHRTTKWIGLHNKHTGEATA
jgi:hypothetical protein